MSDEASSTPFKSLGWQLKELRQKLQESVADVAGAVEIDEVALQRIEQGSERPSEDILMLLISHFGIHEDEATSLWLLAGYDQPMDKDSDAEPLDEMSGNRPVIMMMALDTRVLYSDQAHITANRRGVVLEFMQNGAGLNGQQSQQVPIARIGMSYEQAHDLLKVLHQTLNTADGMRRPKGLPAPNPKEKHKRQKPEDN